MSFYKIFCFCCFNILFFISVSVALAKDVVFSSEFEEYRKKTLVYSVDGITNAVINGGKLGAYAYKYRVNYDLCHTTIFDHSEQVWSGYVAVKEYPGDSLKDHIKVIESLRSDCEKGSACYDLKVKIDTLLKADVNELTFKQGVFDTCKKWRGIHPMSLVIGNRVHYLRFTDEVLKELESDAKEVGFTDFLHPN